jgi:hypothetical protein
MDDRHRNFRCSGFLSLSENESTGGLQQQRLERFYLQRREEKDCIVQNTGGPRNQ